MRLAKNNLPKLRKVRRLENERLSRVTKIADYKSFLKIFKNKIIPYERIMIERGRYLNNQDDELLFRLFERYPELSRSLKKRGFRVDWQFEYGKMTQLFIE